MVVQHNLMAMNSNRMLGMTSKAQAKSTEKLSSGYKINRAADDAAGLAISEKMRKQIRGLTQASANAQDGISAVQTAEGALTEVHDMLQRMNELAVKAGNGTMSESDWQSIQDEIDQLVTEIDRVSETTKFNETYLLKGSGTSKSAGEVSGHIGSVTNSADKLVDGVVTAARGNIYSGILDMTDTTKLDAGTEDIATITYLDEEGNRRTRDITFKTGLDAKGTAKNIADAINEDDVLKKIFKADYSESGKLTVESKLDGTQTDATKNAVSQIEFGSEKDAAGNSSQTRVNKFQGTPNVIAATGESYSIQFGKLTDATVGVASAASTASAADDWLKDGNSVTINGKTYTFDAKRSSSDANSFSTLQELQDLLGNDYTVSMEIRGTKVTANYDASSNITSIAGEEEYSNKVSVVGMSKTITALQNNATDFSEETKNEAKVASGTAVHYKDLKLVLNISQKNKIDPASDIMNFSLQVGADTTEENKISVDIQSMSAKSLGIDKVSVTGKDSTNADKAVNTIADAVAQVSKQRSALGAIQNRLEHTINNLDNVVENTTSAKSAIRDTDMATEMVKYSNNNILTQAGQAMLAQANQSNQGVLSLLG